MAFDANRVPSRGRRALAGVFLGILAALVVGLAAAVPLRGAASLPIVAAMPAVSADALDSRTCRDFTLQHRLGDGLTLCARGHGPVRFDERDGSILELPRGSSVEVETRRGSASQRMLVTEANGQPKHQWWLNGNAQAEGATARAWFADALAAVNGYRQIGEVQGQVGSLQGEIGSIQGEVGSLQGEIGGIQGQIGSLQGKVGSIQGERGSLQGSIGGHQGAIGGLQATRWHADAAQTARIDREIATHAAAIRKLEAELDTGDLSARLAAAEKELDSFERGEARQRIAELEQQIRDVRADERIDALEEQIRDLHADARIAEIERRLKPVVERLKAQVAKLGS